MYIAHEANRALAACRVTFLTYQNRLGPLFLSFSPVLPSKDHASLVMGAADLAVIGPAVQLQYGAVHAWLGQVWSGQVGPARAQSSLIFSLWLVVDQSHFYPCWNWVGLGQGSGSPTPGSCM